MIRTMAFEAQGEPDIGKAAVAHVILNRKKTHRWGNTIKDVVMKPWQFEPWMTRRKDMERLSPVDPSAREYSSTRPPFISARELRSRTM